jgi:hypothetical protein
VWEGSEWVAHGELEVAADGGRWWPCSGQNWRAAVGCEA